MVLPTPRFRNTIQWVSVAHSFHNTQEAPRPLELRPVPRPHGPSCRYPILALYRILCMLTILYPWKILQSIAAVRLCTIDRAQRDPNHQSLTMTSMRRSRSHQNSQLHIAIPPKSFRYTMNPTGIKRAALSTTRHTSPPNVIEGRASVHRDRGKDSKTHKEAPRGLTPALQDWIKAIIIANRMEAVHRISSTRYSSPR